MSAPAQRRFWAEVSVVPEVGQFSVRLDGRPVRTPAKAPLLIPVAALAEAVAAEWDAQGETIDPAAMPLTRAANSAVDKVAPQFETVAAIVAEYGGTDLICYRAESPEALADEQARRWDPWIDWARQDLGAPLLPVAGLMPQSQPGASLEVLGGHVRAFSPFGLTGLHDLVTLSGSLVLGLAVARRAVTAAEAWDLSRVDEVWQQALWGEDEEAAEATAARKRDFLTAATLLDLLERGDP